MNIDRTQILSLALTLILVTSALPAGIVGLVGTAQANHGGNWYTLRQPDANVCHEVQTFTYEHEKMRPEVEVRGTNEIGDVTGSYRDPDWDGFESIESIMDYRYRYYPNGSEHAVGQTEYYAPYLNDQYRAEGWEFGTYGLYNWSDNNQSHMFFYENARGEVSMVVRHDRIYEEVGTSSHRPYNGEYGNLPNDGFFQPSPGSGAVSWDISNLPPGEWAYIDDMYPEGLDDYYTDADGVRYGHREAVYEARPLEEFSGGDFSIDWTWGAYGTTHGTDGGAYRGFHNLASSGPVTIDPSFSGITKWQVRHNDGTRNGNQLALDMNSRLVIQQGRHCPDVSLASSPSDNPPEVGENVTFVASVDESVEVYRWDFDGDGRPDANTSTASVPHAFDSTGGRTVGVVVETSDGITDSAQMSLEVHQNQNPTARMNVEPGDKGLDEYHVVGEQIVLNASVSTDNSGGLVGEYQWDFGDGTNGTGDALVAHTYDEPGEYQVSVQVTDPAGNTDTVTKTVRIWEEDNESPTAQAPERIEVEAGAPATFDGSASGDNRGISSYSWDFTSDGSYEATTANATFRHTPYGSAGNYTATLRVVDGAGNVNTTTVPVRVTAARPPDIGSWSYPERITVGEQVEFSASVTDQSDIVAYEWRINGETVATGETATFTFDREISSVQEANVRLVVVDAAGQVNATDPTPITLMPRDDDAPDARLSVSTNETKVGNSVRFNASASTDEPHRDIAAYHWDFDGNGSTDLTTENPVVSHKYGSANTYNATVIVEDESGNNGTATVRITVEKNQQAQQDTGSTSVNTGPPPVNTDTERTGANSAAIDVKNARSDETVEADLPDSEVASETGVSFQRVAVDLASDDSHVVFETAASADPPGDVAELTAADQTLAYLDFDAKYLDGGVENATVEFTVQKSALNELAEPGDVTVYRYDGAWEQVNATVVETTGDAYRLEATTDQLGPLAVGTSQPLSVTEAGLANDTVTTGEPLTATATVENTGTSARSGTVTLTLDGNVVASETVEVAPGETEAVTLTGTAPTNGTYAVTVGGVSVGNLTVEETRPADVSVTDVSLNTSTIEAGGQVAITATVENTGGEAGEQNVTLTLFGEQLESETVRVAGGETKEVTFVRQVDAPGTYTVKVNGQTAQLEVTEAKDDLTDKAPDVPGFGVGAALAALLAAALLARLRS